MSFSNTIQVLPDAVGASINSAEIEEGAIVNADINNSAAIAVAKLAPLTGDRAVITTAGGVLTTVAPATDNTYLNPTSITISKGIITAIS